MRITYEIVTPESAEHGDAAERGFVEPRFQMKVPIEEVMGNEGEWPKASLEWTLREAEQYLGRHGMEDSGNWFNSLDPDRDYQTGAETYESLHPADNITAASYERLARIFCWDRDPRRSR
jgi:hypothetical protein